MSDKINPEPSPAGDFVLPFDIAKSRRARPAGTAGCRSARALECPHAAGSRRPGWRARRWRWRALLGTALKLDGRLTVQTKSDGPLDLVTADYYGADEDTPSRRARLCPAGSRHALRELETSVFAELAGKGALAITIEPRRGGKTYQGIVELSPDGIAASAETYFAQSEQLPTVIRLAAAPLYVAGDRNPRWRAGGIMLQMTPDAARSRRRKAMAIRRLETACRFSLKTVEDLELVDTGLAPETVLWRLFHEDEVRVQPAEPVTFRCDCDAGRIARC